MLSFLLVGHIRNHLWYILTTVININDKFTLWKMNKRVETVGIDRNSVISIDHTVWLGLISRNYLAGLIWAEQDYEELSLSPSKTLYISHEKRTPWISLMNIRNFRQNLKFGMQKWLAYGSLCLLKSLNRNICSQRFNAIYD